MAKKSNKNLLTLGLSILIILMAVLVALNSWIVWQLRPPTLFVSAGIEIPAGYVQARADIFGNVVSLTAGCDQLTATVNDAQAEAILTGLQNITSYRPLTHDMIRDIVEFFDIDVLAVRIDRMENRTYFGRLLLQQGNRGLSLDVRPSDGIALALRTGAPIWVNQSLFEQHGVRIC